MHVVNRWVLLLPLAVSTQRSPSKKERMQEAAEMLEAGRSPLRDSMILRQSEQAPVQAPQQ